MTAANASRRDREAGHDDRGDFRDHARRSRSRSPSRVRRSRPDGSVVLARRASRTSSRRTVIRSENPSGVRWHTANVGPGASWDVQGVAFVGLGRTRERTRSNSTTPRSHIGTNQVGRYAFHMHHVGSSLDRAAYQQQRLLGTRTAASGRWRSTSRTTSRSSATSASIRRAGASSPRTATKCATCSAATSRPT